MHISTGHPTYLKLSLPLTLFCVLVFCQTILAQSSLFNIPTTDVQTKGEFYVEADFDAQFAKYRNGGWQSYGFLGVYGVSNKVEVGLNAYSTKTETGFGAVELQPNFKFKAYENESIGLTMSAGAIGYLPLGRSFRTDAVASLYGTASKSFNRKWMPRLTAGGYQLAGPGRKGGQTRGLLAGVEQPVHKRINLVGDWNSGKNRFGYAAAGIGIAVTKKSYLYSAYYFGNEGRSNNSFGIYYGVSF